ncbi:MAG: hydrogenase maturation nickel metallochaperone HypA [Bacteroidales bacterium]|nr:hydrogenase maturation nickel metallochaperone HypA [Bacteroidales bacterium]MCF6341500.1 hydrogenase maturation nickel metallochaperone HypA [Bacteroidales bacterium]
MHEFSIALSIIEIAEDEAKKANANAVNELVLDVGALSGIEFEALETAMEMATRNTLLEKAEIKINKIKALAKCNDCLAEFEIENIFDSCPDCTGLFHEILSGKELKVKSLVVDV